jgi:hypothetical protein
VVYAFDILEKGAVAVTPGETSAVSEEFRVAKAVFEVFPATSAVPLLNRYRHTDALIRAQVVRAAGMVAEGSAVHELLVTALDDTARLGADHPDVMGEGLRVCDLAYNQLVLRYDIKGVPRTIGEAQRIEVRDRHIGRLRARLGRNEH